MHKWLLSKCWKVYFINVLMKKIKIKIQVSYFVERWWKSFVGIEASLLQYLRCILWLVWRHQAWGSQSNLNIFYFQCSLSWHNCKMFLEVFFTLKNFSFPFFLLPVYYILSSAADQKAVEQGLYHPTRAGRASENLSPSEPCLCSFLFSPTSNQQMLLVWETRGVLPAKYPVSFNSVAA